MAQNIEIPVSLGLQNASQQVAQLKKILTDAVNPKSSSFDSISNMLDKISRKADELTEKMGDAFKTSSGSKQFLKQYEQLFDMIKVAQDRLTSLGLKDIAFSQGDQQAIDGILDKVKQLQSEIAALEKGKVGNFFDQNDIQGAEYIKETIKSLGKELNALSFSQVSNILSNELGQVNGLIEQSTKKIESLQGQINSLSVNKIADVSAQITAAFKSATTGARFKSGANNYNELLENFYNTFSSYQGTPGKIKSGGTVQDFINSETDSINRGIQAMREKRDEYLKMRDEMLAAFKSSPGNASKEAINQIAEKYKFDISGIDVKQNWTSYWKSVQQSINNTIASEGLVDIDQLRTNMLTSLKSVFDGADLEQIVDTNAFKNQVSNILKNLNLDLSSADIGSVTNAIVKNFDLSDILNKTETVLSQHRQQLEQNAKAEEAILEGSRDKKAKILEAQQTVTTQSGVNTAEIKAKQADLETLSKTLQEYIDKVNQANGTSFKVIDTSGMERGKASIESYISSLTKLEGKQKTLGNIQMAVNRWMGFWQVLNMTKSAINDMKKHIQELDTVMTSISVVTNFSQEDLWNQISQYSEIARQYGVAIKGVYEVSQIYYQQGLQQNDVMTLTTETLKMARIAGLDYATAADYMTTAIRGFKLEMQDASHVTDVFSALAATTASSTEEIAVAISKTASSAEAVGASFEATSAMMATMIATTRESATNIGTALKSVISRYGEMTSDPSATVDSEGQEMSLNRVDTALQTVGITIHNTAGQFRDFDDVMLELMEKWDSLDSLSQRYIATLMAGNRQQSRFLALVSNVDEYKKALETATNAEGTGELQTLKTLDSIDAKIEKMKVTIQEFYTSSGLEELYKNILDIITNIVSAANSLPKAFGKIPLQAIAMGGAIINSVKGVIQLLLAEINNGLQMFKGDYESAFDVFVQKAASSGQEASSAISGAFTGAGKKIAGMLLTNLGPILTLAGSALSIKGLNDYGKSSSIDEDKAAGRLTMAGGLLGVTGSAVSGAVRGATVGSAAGLPGIIAGGILGGLSGLITNLGTLASAFNMLNVTTARTVELARKNAEETSTTAAKAQAEASSLEKAAATYTELQSKAYSSAEAMQEFKDHMNTLADAYPGLISSMDTNGDYIIELESLENALATAREKSAIATANAAQAELQSQQELYNAYDQADKKLKDYFSLDNSPYLQNLQQDMVSWTEEQFFHSIDYDANNWEQIAEGGLISYQKILEGYNKAVGVKDQIVYDSKLKGNDLALKDIISDNFEKIRDFYAEIYPLSNQGLGNQPLSLLNELTESLRQIDSTLSLEELTGFDIESIWELSGTQVYVALKNLQTRIQDYINYQSVVIDNVANSLVKTDVQKYIATAEKQADYNDTFDYNKYSKLISSLVASDEKLSNLAEAGQTDESKKAQYEKLYQEQTQAYLDYFKTNDKLAEKLEQGLDTSNVKNITELNTLLDSEISTDNTTIDEQIKQAYINSWQTTRKGILDLYRSQIIGIFGSFSQVPVSLRTANQFTNSTITALQSDLAQYQKLSNNGQQAMANALLHNIESIYGTIGTVLTSGEDQEQAYEVIKDLDLSDPEALRSAAEIFTEMGGSFASLADTFNEAASRWAINAAALLETISSKALESTKTIETSTSDMSKVFKASEAMEKAQALINAHQDESLVQEDLYQFDKKAGGYVKTAKAFQLEMSDLQESTIASVDQAIEDNQKLQQFQYELFQNDAISQGVTYDNLYDAYLNNQDNSKLIRKIQGSFAAYTHTQIDSPEFDRLWSEYIEINKAFVESGLEDINQFLDDYFADNIANLTIKRDQYSSLTQSMARESLQTYDYKPAISGTATAQNKETLKALLQAASTATFDDATFDHYWEALISGRFEEYNTWLNQWLGLEGIGVTEAEANRTRFTDLASLKSKLEGDIVWSSLDKNEQILVRSLYGAGELAKGEIPNLDNALSRVQVALQQFILAGIGTAEEAGETIESRITTLDKNDIGKQAKEQLSKLSSAKTGDRIDISKIPELADQFGDIYEVGSEYARDSLILALDANKISDSKYRQAVQQAQRQIKRSRAQASNPTQLIAENVSEDVARTYLAAVYQVSPDNTVLGDDTSLRNLMKKRGFNWNEIAQQFEATAEAIDIWQEELNKLITEGTITPEDAAAQQTIIDNLSYSLGAGKKNNAIKDALANAAKAGNDVINNLKAAFATETASWTNEDWGKYIVDNKDGTSAIKIEELATALGYSLDELFSEEVAAIAESYITNASKATSLVSQGTTSQTEKVAFEKAYADAGLTDSVNWIYDSLTHSWTISITQAKQYLLRAATKNGLGGEWVTSQLKAITLDTVDFTGLINGSLQGETLEKNKKAIKDWYEASGLKDASADLLIANLQAGGAAAVNALKGIKPDATSDEIEAAYRSRINAIQTTFNELDKVAVGTFVSANQIEALTLAGFTVDQDGLVTVVNDLVNAYKSLYAQMIETSLATTSELNAAYAKVLNAEDQSNVDIVDALSNAAGMTYDALGELLARYNLSLQAVMDNVGGFGLRRDGFGKVEIIDWNVFSANVFGDQLEAVRGTKEYAEAYKSFNDSIIANNKYLVESITSEISALESAKAGDQINLTQLWTAYQDTIKAGLEKNLQDGVINETAYGEGIKHLGVETNNALNALLLKSGAVIKDGILTLLPDADILGVYQTIRESLAAISESANTDFGDEMTGILDTIDNIIKSYISDIQAGMGGTLTREGANRLTQFATSQLGKDTKLNFKQTAEGLQLTEDSFFKLYKTVAKTNNMLAKKLLPDMSKISDEYGSLTRVMQAYAQAVKNQDLDRTLPLRDLTSQMLDDPNNYKLFDFEVPNTFQEGENLYASMLSAHNAASALSRGDTMSVQDFTSLAQMFMLATDEDGNPNNKVRQYGLDMLKNGAEWITADGNIDLRGVRRSGNIVGLKQMDEWLSDYFTAFQKTAVKHQAPYNLLNYGSRSLGYADIWDTEGDLDVDALRELVFPKNKKDQTDQGKSIQQLLESLILKRDEDSVETMADRLKNGDLGELDKDLIKTLSTINWDDKDIESQIHDKLSGKTGNRGGKVRVKDDGSVEIELVEDSDQWHYVYDVDGQEFTADQYREYAAVKGEENFRENEVSPDSDVKASYTFEVSGHEVTVEFKSDGTVSYSCDMDEWGIVTASTQADLYTAIKALYLANGQEDGLSSSESGEDSDSERVITIDGASYSIKVDSKGEVSVEGTGSFKEEYRAALEQIVKDSIGTGDAIVTTVDSLSVDPTNSTATLVEGATLPTLTVPSMDVEVEEFNIVFDTNNSGLDADTLASNVQTDIQNAVDNIEVNTKDIGENIPAGVAVGVDAAKGEAVSAAREMGEQAIVELADAMGVASPSIYAKEDGEFLGQGLVEGIESQKGSVGQAGTELGQAATDGILEGLDDMDARVREATGSIASHFETLSTQVVEAIQQIQEAIAGLQQHVSITWEINAASDSELLNSVLGGNYAGYGSGTSTTANPGNGTAEMKIPISADDTEFQEVYESVVKKIQELAALSPVKIDIEPGDQVSLVQTTLELISESLDIIIQHADTKLKVETETPGRENLQNVVDNLAQVVNKDPIISITTQGLSALQEAAKAIGGIVSKHEIVTVEYRSVGKVPTGGGCFVAGTKIYMADGSIKNIEDVLIGDKVIAYNDESHQFEPRTITKSYTHHDTPRVLQMTFSNGVTLGITPGHPILTTHGWKSRDIANSAWEHNTQADWLNLGDTIIGYQGNIKLLSIKEVAVPEHYDTYNIEVETCHTYMVEGLVVHNAKAVRATGNVGLSRAKGTLMGELGPELVVSKGRYHIVGANGPEMVDLDEDAIVFNHLQTKSLLTKGTSRTRGKAITNEKNAVAYAQGTGPAYAKAEKSVADGGSLSPLQKASQVASKVLASVKKVFEPVTKAVATVVQNTVDVAKAIVNPIIDSAEQARQQAEEQAKQQQEINDKQERAAESLQDAGSNLNQAAENIAESAEQQQEATQNANKYASQQESRGLVHPGAAPKLREIKYNLGGGEGGGGGNGGTNDPGAAGNYVLSGAVGTGSTLNRSYSSALRLVGASGGGQSSGGGGDGGSDITVKDAEAAVKSFLTDLLKYGIESIDLDNYEKMPDNVRAEVQHMIDTNESYRNFVKAYALALNESMSEINSTYFQAWQKDLEAGGLAEEQFTALEGLKFFANGEIGGSADDWTTLLGDKAFVGDAVDAGVLQWNAALRTYVATSREAVAQFMNTQLDNIWTFPDAIVDSAADIAKEINDLITKALSDEGLSAKDTTRLEELLKKQGYVGDLIWSQTADGEFLLTDASAKSIAKQMQKSASDKAVDASQAYAKNVLASIFDGFNNASLTREAGNAINGWLSTQGKSLASLGIAETDTGYSVDWSVIMAAIDQFGDEFGDIILDLVSSIDIDKLDNSQAQALSEVIQKLGTKKADEVSTKFLDGILDRVNSIADYAMKAFGDGNFISNADYGDLVEKMKASGLDPSKLNFTKTAEGYTASFEDIIALYGQLIDTYPTMAEKLLQNIADETLTSEQASVKAKLLAEAKDVASSAKILDSIVTRRSEIIQLVLKGLSKEGLTNVDKDDLQKKFKAAYGIDFDFDFKQSGNGFSIDFGRVMAAYEVIKQNSQADADKFLKDLSVALDLDSLTEAELQMYIKAINEAKINDVISSEEVSALLAPIADAIHDRTLSMIDYVKQGISGSLSNAGLDKLKDLLVNSTELTVSRDELDKNLSTTMTADGLKLDTSSLKYLQSILGDKYSNYISKFNELYFDAWEREMELPKVEASKNLQYFGGGGIGGSREDLEKLFGNTVKVGELVEKGLIKYNDILGKYYVASTDFMDIDPDVLADGLRSTFNEMGDKLEAGLSGTLSNIDAKKLVELAKLSGLEDLELSFEKTAEGLRLPAQEAAHLYAELKKVDALQATLVFDKLNNSLKETDDRYKTVESVMNRIVELQRQIDAADKNVSDARIKQYQEELALAKEILAVRSTSEDSSFNFLDNDIPGAMNNPLNYVNNWITAWKSLRTAAEDGSAIDFKQFYNMLQEMNNLANITGQSVDFLGVTLDGSARSINAAVDMTINALGSDASGQFGVLLSNFGDGLTAGVDSYADSADNAIHGMAQAQIKVLDGLIQMFEAIVAMEAFDGVDLDMDGILSIGEIFKDGDTALEDAIYFTDAFTDSAVTLAGYMDKNSELREAFESVKINGINMKELILDATDGIKNLNLDAKTYASVTSLLYQAAKSGNYDVNDIASSLRKVLASSAGDFKGTLEFGDFVLDLQYDVKITKTEDGQYKTPGGAVYDNPTEAVRAAALEQEGIKGDTIKIDPETHSASGTLYINSTAIEVEALDSGIYYTVPGHDKVGTKEEALRLVFEDQGGGSDEDFTKWKLENGITVSMSVTNVEVENLTAAQVQNAVGKTWSDVKSEWDAAKGNADAQLAFEAKYGVHFDDHTTEADWNRFKEMAGIDSKNVEITASVSMADGGAGGLMAAIESGVANVQVNLTTSGDGTISGDANGTLTLNTEGAKAEADSLANAINAMSATMKVDADTSGGQSKAESLQRMADAMQSSITISAIDNASSTIRSIQYDLDQLKDKTVTVTTIEKKESADSGSTSAKGTFGGAALAGGTKTLMGELGPELYVTNGRYYMAGQGGAEFVNLPDDAIVFNHMQTERLLSSGATGRGKPITNAMNAISMAKGSLGPAMASASQTLATLKQLRAMWAKLADSSIVDLAGVGGADGNIKRIGPWLAEVERWYNLLQKIAQLEKEINYQEQLRNKIASDRIPDGEQYYQLQKDSLANYAEQARAQRELYESQQEYFDLRRKELNEREAPFADFYTFDESGQLKFKDGAYSILSSIVETDEWGAPKYTPAEQAKMFEELGFGEYMKYNSSGELITRDENDKTGEQYDRDRVQAVWERMEAERTEMQNLHDSIEDAKVSMLAAETNGNKLLQEIVDNQLKIEDNVLKAIEDREQAIIDGLKDEKEAIQESSDTYVKGLREALSKEREMYKQNEDKNELAKLQRQLAILQRSGGSASQIASLQNQIRSKEQDSYFSAQEAQIDAVEDAAKAQLERLDTQIEIMTETLEYSKEHGLLWNEVKDIMSGSAESIISFLTGNTADFQAKSTLGQQEALREYKLQTEQWTEYRDDYDKTNVDVINAMTNGFEAEVDARYNPEDLEAKSAADKAASEAYWNHLTDKKAAEEAAKQAQAAAAAQATKTTTSSSSYSSNYYGSAYSQYERAKANDPTMTPSSKSSMTSSANKTTAATTPSGSTAKPSTTVNSKVAANEKQMSESNSAALMDKYHQLTAIQTEAIHMSASIRDKTATNNEQSHYQDLVKEQNQLINELCASGFKWPEIKVVSSSKGFASGDIVDYTGPAMVHGSKSRPEAFLNASQTQLWKEQILGGSNSSLTSRLLDLRETLTGIENASNITTTSNASSLVIEKAEVNMNVSQIANDYDARRAGETALEEMMRIARKTSAANSIRR